MCSICLVMCSGTWKLCFQANLLSSQRSLVLKVDLSEVADTLVSRGEPVTMFLLSDSIEVSTFHLIHSNLNAHFIQYILFYMCFLYFILHLFSYALTPQENVSTFVRLEITMASNYDITVALISIPSVAANHLNGPHMCKWHHN